MIGVLSVQGTEVSGGNASHIGDFGASSTWNKANFTFLEEDL